MVDDGFACKEMRELMMIRAPSQFIAVAIAVQRGNALTMYAGCSRAVKRADSGMLQGK